MTENDLENLKARIIEDIDFDFFDLDQLAELNIQMWKEKLLFGKILSSEESKLANVSEKRNED